MNLLRPAPGRRLALERHEPGRPPGQAVQDSFADLGVPLREATFVVVDLETTGGSPTADRITEIGAVKVRGGQVLGEFSTLVNPGVAIPPQITLITGITTAMVVDAPRIEEVLPTFLEFARGAIFVAHNARFDMGFLRAAAKSQHLTWAPPGQVDTLALARRVVTRDEAPNHKLASLSRLFHAATSPNHRALADARATVDVFHGLLERLASLGVTHVEDLATAADAVPPGRRRKVHLVAHAPPTPGVYTFRGPGGEALYVGTAKNLRRRLRGYFTSAPDRRRIGEMVDLAHRVDVIECPTVLEAQVRELRLIAELDPPYNRRSGRPGAQPWLRLTDEALPRLSIVRSVPPAATAVGPFSSRSRAQEALEALQALGVRACTQKLPLRVSPEAQPCALLQLGRCAAPCARQEAADEYHRVIERVRAAAGSDAREVFCSLTRRMADLAEAERFEDAARVRNRLTSLLTGAHRWQRLSPWWNSTNTVAARLSTDADATGAWEVVVVRHGRLAATGVCPRGREVPAFAADLADSAAYVAPPARQGGAASAEETALIATWMETPGVRLLTHEGSPLAWPVHGAKTHLEKLARRSGTSP